jgi:hypothetical protein
MPAGWRTVIVEHWPDRIPGHYNRADLGEVSVVQRLPPDASDPSQAQLDAWEATFSRYGGVASARVVGMFWFGIPVLTPEQQRAVAGLP